MSSTTKALYRPPQWAKGPSKVSITTVTSSTSGATAAMYVFDAVLEVEHEQRVEKTHHPVQTGSDVSSHAYLQAARCVLLVGMSDTMASYTSASVKAWPGASKSKSVNAYQALLALQIARQPFTVTTRLRTYTNMLLVSLPPREDYKTFAGMRARVEFEQVFLASTSTAAVSARTDATTQTSVGTVNTSPVPSTTKAQFKQPPPKSTLSQSSTSSTTQSDMLPVGTPITPSNFQSYPFAPITLPGAGAYSSSSGQTGLAR